MRVLVAYASVHGSTKSVAERVASTLKAGGMQVDVADMQQAPDTRNFDAYVLGSCIYDQAWLEPVLKFLAANRDHLVSCPVWLFSVGMPGALALPLRSMAMKEGPKIAEALEEFVAARDHHLFSGVVEKDHLPMLGRAMLRLLGNRFGDFRNWEEIDAWARQIAGEMTAGDLLKQRGLS